MGKTIEEVLAFEKTSGYNDIFNLIIEDLKAGKSFERVLNYSKNEIKEFGIYLERNFNGIA